MACKVARRSLCSIAFYSGNTRQIAKLVQQETGGDLCEIEIATPYTGSYNDVVDQGQREVNSGFTPKLKPVSADLKKLRYCDTGHAGLVVHLRTSNADTAPEQ